MADIIRLGPQKVQEQEKTIIGAYPNTYTFTKSLTEKMIKKLRGNLPVVIVRPSIIQGNYEDPFMGWTDTIAASGFQMMMSALGILHFLHMQPDTVLDCIPCDFVCNQILVQTVFTAREQVPSLNVVHATTSSQNPLKLKKILDFVIEYDSKYPFYMKGPDKKVWV